MVKSAQNTQRTNNVTCSTTEQIFIPFELWDSGAHFDVEIYISDLGNYFQDGPNRNHNMSASSASNKLSIDSAKYFGNSSGLWIVVRLRYFGPASRSTLLERFVASLPQKALECRLPTTGLLLISLSLTLLGAQQAVSDAVAVTVDTAIAVSALVMVPSSVVRGGLLRSILSMLRCSDFDPKEKIGFLNNPFGWAVGGEDLQYQRGSAVTTLICYGLGAAAAALAVVIARTSHTSFVDALTATRLPSVPLVFIVLLLEVSVAPATSLIFFSGSSTADICIGVTVLGPLLLYLTGYWQGAVAARRNLDNVRTEEVKVKGLIKSTLHRLLAPTHVQKLCDTSKEGWLRLNFYFVSDRTWPIFGVIEVCAGLLSSVLEGIPQSSNTPGLCVARPVSVVATMLCLLGMQLVKVPNAVPLQHWIGVILSMLLLFTGLLAIVSVVKPSEPIEAASNFFGGVVSVSNLILALVELATTALEFAPKFRSRVGLQSRSFWFVLQQALPRTPQALQIPILATPARPRTSSEIQLERRSSSQQDATSVTNDTDDDEDQIIEEILAQLNKEEREGKH